MKSPCNAQWHFGYKSELVSKVFISGHILHRNVSTCSWPLVLKQMLIAEVYTYLIFVASISSGASEYFLCEVNFSQ